MFCQGRPLPGANEHPCPELEASPGICKHHNVRSGGLACRVGMQERAFRRPDCHIATSLLAVTSPNRSAGR